MKQNVLRKINLSCFYNFKYFLAIISLFIITGCNQLYDLTDPSIPLQSTSFNSLDELVNYSASLGYVPSYTTNGREYGLISGADVGTCVVMKNGKIKCWGNNSFGALGNGTTVDSYTPVTASILPVTTVSSSGEFAVAVSAAYQTTCAYFKSGFKCWGSNTVGQFGTGSVTGTAVLTPTTVTNISGKSLKSFAVGDSHACALYTDNTIGCWGDNTQGQLGDGTNTARLSGIYPSLPATDKAVSYLSCSDAMTCAITTSGKGYCWGNSIGGAAYRGFLLSTSPTLLSNGATSVSSGDGDHMCFINPNQSMSCYGSNGSGQLGNSSITNSTTLVGVSNISGASMNVGGDSHTCAVTNDYSSVYCWGDNNYGQLGNASGLTQITAATTPVSGFPSGTKIVDISASDKNTCALLSNDDVYCWGSNQGSSGAYLGVAAAQGTKFNTAVKVLNRADP